MSLLSIVGSIVSGGVTGILGAGIQRVADYMNKKQDIEIMKLKFTQDTEMRKIDMQMLDKEWAARTDVALIEADAKKEVADTEAFKETLWKEPDRYSAPSTSGWMIALDFLRGLIRPGLTVYLAVIVTMMYLEVQGLLALKDLMTATDVFSIYEQIINSILYLFTTVVLWYFGTRNKGKQPGQK